jgi:hypothetical protein
MNKILLKVNKLLEKLEYINNNSPKPSHECCYLFPLDTIKDYLNTNNNDVLQQGLFELNECLNDKNFTFKHLSDLDKNDLFKIIRELKSIIK